MKVCIAEKPSVAREIAYILGAKNKMDGYFEGNGYGVTWTFGHFCSLKEPNDYKDEWKKWRLDGLPILPDKFETKVKKDKGVKKQFGIVKKLFKQASVVINCGDAGQEGELIQRWVINQAKYKGKVERLWISSLTAEAIREGFKNLQDASLYDNLYYAGSSRAIGDWLLGMNATRLYTLKYGGYKQVLSIGRVQTPTLAMVVKRHWEIVNFKPEPFWELQTVYRDTVFNCEKGRFTKKEEGETLLEKVKDAPFTILSVTKKEGLEYAPRLFDLTSLQVYCNQRFSYSADQTLKLVQKLYELKVITYPRVDTTFLPNDVYPKVPGILKKMTNFGQFTQPLLSSGQKLRKTSRVFNDKKVTDHHAIIPTGEQKNLSMMEQNVYDIIARRFIAAFYPDCKVLHANVQGEAAGVKFKTRGKEILDPGWRVLFAKPKSSKTTTTSGTGQSDTDDKGKQKKIVGEKFLPPFVKGETGPHKATLIEKMTQPPKYYTEATLLRAMETAGKQVDDEELRDLMKSNGIGRPSTRAGIIETLFRRSYIYRQKKSLIPTDSGIQLIDVIQYDLLKSPEMTGQWEKQLRDIEQGKHSAQVFVKEMKEMVDNLVKEVKLEQRQIKISDQTYQKDKFKKGKSGKGRVGTKNKTKSSSKQPVNLAELACPKCQKGTLLKGKSAYGCSQWKTGCDFRLPFSFKGKKLPEKQLARLLKLGATVQLKGFKEGGKSATGKALFDSNFNLIFVEKAVQDSFEKKAKKPKKSQKKEVATCPKCKQGILLKGKTAYGCSRWKEGCDFRFLFAEIHKQAAGRKLTKDLVLGILSKGV